MNTSESGQGLFRAQQGTFAPAGLLVAARVANIVVSLGMIPLLVHFLGGSGFAAWALLLATGAVFSLLEIGMALTFVKHAAPLIEQRNWAQVSSVMTHVATIVGLAFSAAAPAVLWFASDAAGYLQLPDGAWLTGGEMIIFVFVAAAARALLQFGALTFNASRRFAALAVISFLQSLAANCAATLAAAWTGRLEVVLVAYWVGQLVVLIAAAVAARRFYAGAAALTWPGLAMIRKMVGHGLKIQVSDWTQIVNFQFDKFLIAGYTGLWTVAPYEVANRSVLALRSIPSSGLDSFLATAAIGRESGHDPWPRYEAFTRLAADAAVVFLIIPLAIAPVFLYAWTGELGYSARWVFMCLLVGAAGNILAMPAASMAQAAGRADIQARAAVVSTLINIPLSIIFVFQWNMTGAAAGTAIALLAGSAMLLVQVHRAYHRPLSGTVRNLDYLWPLLLVALVCGLLVYGLFENWLTSLDAITRYSWQTRLSLAVAAGAAYLGCLLIMIAVQIFRGSLLPEQEQFLCRWIRFKWFATYCAGRAANIRK